MKRLDHGDDELSVSQAVDGEKAIFVGTTSNNISTLQPTNETFSAGADDFLRGGSVSLLGLEQSNRRLSTSLDLSLYAAICGKPHHRLSITYDPP